VPAVSVRLSPRARVLAGLAIGSVFFVFLTWGAFGWHARGMILAACGVVFLAAGLIPAWRARGLLQSGTQAQGTVVDVEETRGGFRSAGTTYSPVVQFTTLEGRTMQFTSPVGTSRRPDIGGVVPVRYRFDQPEQAEIDRGTTWMLPAAMGLVPGLVLLVAAVIVYSHPASTTPESSPVTGTPQYWAAGAKVVPAPSGFTLSQSSWLPNGPMSAAVFNRYWDDPVSLHFVRGYNVGYDSNTASDSIEVTLFQFATPADAARFKADFVPTETAELKADPVIPGAEDYNSTSPDQGTYLHGVIATRGNRAFVIEDTTASAAPVPLVETMARQQYAAL
jgi:hypothetical protein